MLHLTADLPRLCFLASVGISFFIMDISLKKLPKELLENDPHKHMGRRMLNSARKDIVDFLLNTPMKDQGTGRSGFMTDSDKDLVEEFTGKKVDERSESCEIFYRLKNKTDPWLKRYRNGKQVD